MSDLILVLTKKEIKVRYKHSILGFFWSLLNPLASMLIFYILFQLIFNVREENFVLILLTGLFTWQWILSYINMSTKQYIQNYFLIKKIRFPRYVLPFSANLQFCFHFIASIPVIFIVMFLYSVPLQAIFLIGIPVLIIIQLLILFGIGLIVSSITVFFRDMENIVPILMQITFYLTPVLYDFSRIPAHLQPYALINPFASILLLWRGLFLQGLIDSSFLLVAVLQAVIWLGLGMFTYAKLEWKFSEVL